jgi:protein-tyrosine phosphatase
VDPASVAYIELGSGALGVMRRPKLKVLPQLRADGATHLVTLLADSDANQLGAAAARAGLSWIWIPLFNGDPPHPDRDDDLRRRLEGLVRLIEAGGRVVLHCSAGLHRTGMVAYAILRLYGSTQEEARAQLASVRSLEEVGEERLGWGERLLR